MVKQCFQGGVKSGASTPSETVLDGVFTVEGTSTSMFSPPQHEGSDGHEDGRAEGRAGLEVRGASRTARDKMTLRLRLRALMIRAALDARAEDVEM